MASRVIAGAEPLLLIAITPLLLFPTLRPSWTALALGLLAILWIFRALLRRETSPAAPVNLALLLFCLTIPMGVWASAVPELTLPKLTSLILGLAAFRAIVLSVHTCAGLFIALAVSGLLGLGIWILGLLGSNLSVLQPLIQRLPDAAMAVIGGSDRAVNPNVLAGSLVVYLPVLLTFAAYGWRTGRWLVAITFVLVSVLIAATLFLTQSRSAMLGAAASTVALAFLLAWFRIGRKGKRFLAAGLVALVLVTVVAGAWLAMGRAGQADSAAQGAALSAQITLTQRVEIWSRALYALQDFPFTGVGLGTFGRVMQLLYPLFLSAPNADIRHAHNILLQVGVDHGLGGLIAYIAILLTSAVTAWQAASRRNGVTRYVALGLLCSLVGLHVYGITDALEAKPAIVLWVLLGLIAALANDPGKEEAVQRTP